MPKLLWFSPLSIHDTSSSSASQMRNMLLSLKARNVDIVVLSALCFLNENGTTMFNNLDESLAKSQDSSFNLNDNNINCIYIRTQSRSLGAMSSQEQRAFYAKFCGLINAFKPDVVMGSGSDVLSMVCFDEAKRRALPTVYTLLDGTPRRFNFPNIDVVVTDSNAISALYASKHQINAVVTGSFLPVAGPLLNNETPQEPSKKGKGSKHKDGRYRITMINPALDKGVAIFTKLAQKASKDFKQYQFSVYESYQGQFNENIAKTHYQNSDKTFESKELAKIDVLDPKYNLQQLLAETKVLVVPSLSFEGVVNIAREAIAHGIPVLSSNQTGIAESIGQAGVLVEVASYLLNDHSLIPHDEDSENFLKGLNILLSQDFSDKCREVCQSYDVNHSANRLALILKPLFDKRASQNPQLLRNGSLI